MDVPAQRRILGALLRPEVPHVRRLVAVPRVDGGEHLDERALAAPVLADEERYARR
jgi:hypothetical protein